MTNTTTDDSALKAKHRTMWASGSYPTMVETFLLPLGPRLVDAFGIGPGDTVLDVAAGTGNAALPAARAGADVTASDLTPELLDAGREGAEAEGLELRWAEADAEHLPFGDASYDVVMSAIGAMFAPFHQPVADELVRVCRPGGKIGLLSWTPEGMIGSLFRTIGQFAPPPPAGAQPPPLWGGEEHVRGLFGDRVELQLVEKGSLEVTAFASPHEYGEHFKALLRPDDRRPRQRRQERPRGGVRRRPRRVLRRVEPRQRRAARRAPRAAAGSPRARGRRAAARAGRARPPARRRSPTATARLTSTTGDGASRPSAP